MANLVFLSKENTPLTTSNIIADCLQYEHKSVIQLVRNHIVDLEEFGKVCFVKLQNKEKIIKNQNSTFEMRNEKAGRKTEIAYLNEHQATLLICFMKNTPKVRKFKVDLVRAFFKVTQQLQQLQLQNQPKTDSLPLYTQEQVAEQKKKSYKQGFAVACAYLKKDENGLTAQDRKQLEKAKAFVDWYTDKRSKIHETWKLQRELTHELRELTYQLEQSGDLFSLLFGGYVGTLSEVSYYLNNKLQETNK